MRVVVATSEGLEAVACLVDEGATAAEVMVRVAVVMAMGVTGAASEVVARWAVREVRPRSSRTQTCRTE